MIDTTVPDAPTTASGMPAGASAMSGGFGRAGLPVELIGKLIAHGVRALTHAA